MLTLFERMRDAGAAFVANGDRLSIRATRALPVDLLTDLRCHRVTLLERYRERCAIREHDAGTDRTEAERLAACDVIQWLAEQGRGGEGSKVLPPKRSLVTPYEAPDEKFIATPERPA